MIRWFALTMSWLLALGLASGQGGASADPSDRHQAKSGLIQIIPVAITYDVALGERARRLLARKHIDVGSMQESQSRRYVLIAKSRIVASQARKTLETLHLRHRSLGLGVYREGLEKGGKREYTATIPGTTTRNTWTVPTR